MAEKAKGLACIESWLKIGHISLDKILLSWLKHSKNDYDAIVKYRIYFDTNLDFVETFFKSAFSVKNKSH